MVRIEGEILINRPTEEVFDFVADERNEPRYNPKMRLAQRISEGPIGVGTRFRAEIVSMGRTIGMVSSSPATSDPGGSRHRRTCPPWILTAA
jgi:hypothetical protein